MDKSTREDQAVPQTLAQVRAQHAQRLKKVERAVARLDKQQRKLAALEAELALLSQQETTALCLSSG